MDFLKAQIDRIQQQLAGLTASQRMLTGALVVIMVMTLVWLGKYAGAPEMTPLLEQSLQPDEIGRINSYLESKGISTVVTGDKLMVPKDRQYAILADLGYAQMLPRDTKTGFDFIAKNMSTWDSQQQTDRMWNEAKQLTLAQIIRGFPDVTNAQVIIDPTSKRPLGGEVKPTASININMRSGAKPDKKLIYAAADLVCGSQANLSRGSINVIIDGQPYPIRDNDNMPGMPGNEVMELKQASEQYYISKVLGIVSWMGNTIVSVSCEVENTDTTTHSVTYDSKGKVSMPKKSQERTEETRSSGGGSGEPGLVPNTSVGIDGGGGETNSTTVTENTTDFENVVPTIDTQKVTPAGTATPVAASVRVPRSYFSRIWKGQASNIGKEPTDADIDQMFQVQEAKIRQDVKNATGIKAEDSVSVALYTDEMPGLDQAPAVASGTMNLLMGGHVKELALGALAVVSLFMVSMMVRKASPALPVAPAPLAPEPTAQLSGAEAIAGEVGEASPLLDGMEVDEESVKTQQMISQVQSLVKQNPDSAANLVKRWLNRA